MAKKKYDSSEGIWRTIGGRRVFIKTGQSLSDAMKDSGKFKTKMNEKAVKGAREEDLKEQYKDSLNNVSKMEYNGEITKEEYDKAVKDINKAYIGKRNEYLKGERTYEQVDKEWTDLAKKMEKDYDEFGTTNWQDEKRLNQLSLERDTLSIKDDKFYTRKDGTKEYDPYKGTRFEKKYDSVEDALNDPNHPTRKYIDSKFSSENPVKKEYKNGKYNFEYKDGMLTMKDKKGNELNSWGLSKENWEENKDYWKDKAVSEHKEEMYWLTKDVEEEFGENADFNTNYLHKQKGYSYKQIENMPNEEYDTMFKDWKQEKSLKNRYKDTYDYLKNTKNMSGAEILELLKRIDKDKK